MGWLDNLFARMGYTKTQAVNNAPPFLLENAGAMRYNIPDYSLAKNQAELLQRLSWVYAAVLHTADYAATTALNVYSLWGERRKDIPNHDFELLLQHPNPLQSRFEFLEATFAYLRLTGNAYWWLNRAEEKDKPAEIWILPTHRVMPVPDEHLYIEGYKYMTDDGHEELMPPYQVAHFKRFHPLNEFVGLSPVEPLAVVAAGDLGQQKYNAKVYGANNGRLPGILGFGDMIQDPTWTQIKTDLKDASDSRNYLLLRGLGKGGVELLAAPTPKDMEALASRTFTKEEIFSVFAPGLASVLAVNATEANARTGKSTLIDFTVWPMMCAVAEKVTNDILPVYGKKLVAEFEDIRVTDRALALSEQAEYAKTHTIDEIRDEYYQDDPLGDERGELLPAQIAAGSSVPGEEPEEPVTPVQPTPPEHGEMEQMPEEAPEVEPTADMPMEQPPMMDMGQKADLERWRRKAMSAVKHGKPAAVTFTSTAIPADMHETITARLASAQTAEDVSQAFVFAETKTDPLTDLIAALREAAKALQNEPREAA